MRDRESATWSSRTLARLGPACLLAVIATACQAPPPAEGPPRPAAAPAPSSEPPPPFWGGLRPGDYDVGFQHLVFYDTTRLFRGTKPGGDAGRAASKLPRPIFVGLWYPSPRGASASKPFSYSHYLDWDFDNASLAPLKAQLASYGRTLLSVEVTDVPWADLDPPQKERIERLLATPTAARASAPHIAAPMPLLLYHHSAQGTFEESSILMEYLASHGYVAASLVSAPSEVLSVSQGGSIDDEIRDADFVIQSLHREAWVDKARLGVVGHSIGAQYSLVFAAGHASVDAAVSLDTTWDYPRRQQHLPLETYYQRYAAGAPQMITPILGVASTGAEYKPFDLPRHAPRHLVMMGDLDHDDYLSQKAAAARVPPDKGAPPDAKAAAYLLKYEQLCEITRTFFDAYVRSRADERAILSRMPSKEQAAMGIAVQERPAAPAPPGLRDLRDIVVERGAAAAMARCNESKAQGDGCPDDWALSVADGLLEEERIDPAVSLLDAHIAASPDDFDATLSLAKALARKGDNERARAAYERVLQKAPKVDKPSLDLTPTQIRSFICRREAEAALSRLGSKKAAPP